ASRTRLLFDDFARSFSDAEEVILPDIYFVRDSPVEQSSVSSADLAAEINRNGGRARHLPRFEQIVQCLRSEARPGDLIVTMGAGTGWEIGRDLVDSRASDCASAESV